MDYLLGIIMMIAEGKEQDEACIRSGRGQDQGQWDGTRSLVRSHPWTGRRERQRPNRRPTVWKCEYRSGQLDRDILNEIKRSSPLFEAVRMFTLSSFCLSSSALCDVFYIFYYRDVLDVASFGQFWMRLRKPVSPPICNRKRPGASPPPWTSTISRFSPLATRSGYNPIAKREDPFSNENAPLRYNARTDH